MSAPDTRLCVCSWTLLDSVSEEDCRQDSCHPSCWDQMSQWCHPWTCVSCGCTLKLSSGSSVLPASHSYFLLYVAHWWNTVNVSWPWRCVFLCKSLHQCVCVCVHNRKSGVLSAQRSGTDLNLSKLDLAPDAQRLSAAGFLQLLKQETLKMRIRPQFPSVLTLILSEFYRRDINKRLMTAKFYFN